MILHHLFSWVALLLSSAYDDIMIVNYISNKNVISLHLGTGIENLYHTGTFYSLGFLIGVIGWNLVIHCFSNKRLLNLIQVLLLLSIIAIFFIKNIALLFFVNFIQGLLISGTLLLVYTLVRYNFNQSHFERFIMLSSSLVYLTEACIPLVNLYLRDRPIPYIVLIFAMFLISQYTAFIRFKDPPKAVGLKVNAYSLYTKFINTLNSKFVLLFIMCAICEGLNDTLLNLVEGILDKINCPSTIVYYFLSGISIASSLAIYIISTFVLARKPNHGTNSILQKFDFMSNMLKFLLCLLIPITLLPSANLYAPALFYVSLFLVGSAGIHYLCLYILHAVYKDSSLVVSILLTLETVASIFFKVTCLYLRYSSQALIIYIVTFMLVMLLIIKSLTNYILKSKTALEGVPLNS